MTTDTLQGSTPPSAEVNEGIQPEAVGLPPGIDIIHIREGGLIDCYIPMGLIDTEEVSVREDWAEELAKQMRDQAELTGGGSGQNAQVTMGRIEGEDQLKIMDGFHRVAALGLNGEERVYATIRQVDWDELYDYRILTTKEHSAVQFSRVIQWINEIWHISGLPEKVTAAQAMSIKGQGHDGTSFGLTPEETEQVREWVADKEQKWGLAAMSIHADLKIAENVDQEIIHSVRKKARGDKLDGPTRGIVKIFSTELPKSFEMQHAVLEIAKEFNLKEAQVRALSRKFAGYEDLEEALEFAEGIEWDTWEPEYGETKARSMRKAQDPRQKGTDVFKATDAELAKVLQRVQQSLERGEKMGDDHIENVRAARERATELQGELGTLMVAMSALLGEEAPEQTAAPPATPVSRRPSRERATPPTVAIDLEVESEEGDIEPTDDTVSDEGEAVETDESEEPRNGELAWDDDTYGEVDEIDLDDDVEPSDDAVSQAPTPEATPRALTPIQDLVRGYLMGEHHEPPEIRTKSEIRMARAQIERMGGVVFPDRIEEIRDDISFAESILG